MINAEILATIKPSACLINISYDGIVDHTALSKALQDCKLVGAASYVYPKEPLRSNSPLWVMPNIILTPHISGARYHYNERTVALFANNLNHYLSAVYRFSIFLILNTGTKGNVTYFVALYINEIPFRPGCPL